MIEKSKQLHCWLVDWHSMVVVVLGTFDGVVVEVPHHFRLSPPPSPHLAWIRPQLAVRLRCRCGASAAPLKH